MRGWASDGQGGVEGGLKEFNRGGLMRLGGQWFVLFDFFKKWLRTYVRTDVRTE